MKDRLIGIIRDFVATYGPIKATQTDWEEPLVAFARADDPLFKKLKQFVCSEHFQPGELLASANSVIAFFVPFKRNIALSNQKGNFPSEEWMTAYVETNRLIVDLSEHVSSVLRDSGWQSEVLPPTHNFDPQSLLSRWSHKHVGFIAGLGRFGLHRMLITDKGVCGRLGSLVSSLKVEPSPKKIREYCLYEFDKSCKECVKKCVNGSLQVKNFDRHRCYDQLHLQAGVSQNQKLADVCGKCVCTVPCSFVNPVSGREASPQGRNPGKSS